MSATISCGPSWGPGVLPQIRAYQRNRAARCSISLLTWGGWIAIACVTMLYAVCVIDNMLIAAIAGLNAVAQITVLGFGILGRSAPTRIIGLGSESGGERTPPL